MDEKRPIKQHSSCSVVQINWSEEKKHQHVAVFIKDVRFTCHCRSTIQHSNGLKLFFLKLWSKTLNSNRTCAADTNGLQLINELDWNPTHRVRTASTPPPPSSDMGSHGPAGSGPLGAQLLFCFFFFFFNDYFLSSPTVRGTDCGGMKPFSFSNVAGTNRDI